MSFFSRSHDRNHYRNGNYGQGYYKRKGILGKLMGLMSSSRNGGEFPPYPRQNPMQPVQPTGMSCTNCSAIVPAGSKFCLECGKKMDVNSFCDNCGDRILAKAKFCPQCGVSQNK